MHPACNVLNIWQLAICSDRTLLDLAKDAIGKEKTFQPCSTPVKPVSSEALLLFMINQKSAFQANKGFTCLFSLSGFDVGLRQSFMTKSAVKTNASMCR